LLTQLELGRSNSREPWKSSYILFARGMAAAALVTRVWLVDAHALRRWTKRFELFGVFFIPAFVGSV